MPSETTIVQNMTRLPMRTGVGRYLLLGKWPGWISQTKNSDDNPTVAINSGSTIQSSRPTITLR